MTAWTSMALRPNTTTPEGQVPISGGYCQCPDIIPLQVADPNPQATFSTPASWATTYPANVVAGAANYLYVRAKNWAPGAETATVTLYAAGSSVINWPSDWLANPLPVQQSGGTSQTLSATTNQQIVVTPQPFYWQAPPPPAGSDHYCLFALLDSPDNPNQLLHGDVPQTYNTMADLVTNELYVGWKNVAEVGPSPDWTHQVQMPLPPVVPGNTLLHVYFYGTAGTVGGQVTVTTGDGVSYNPPINIPQQKIASPSETYGMLTTPVEGTSTTWLNVSFWHGTSNPGFKDRITVVCGWVPPSSEQQTYQTAGVGRALPEHLVGLGADMTGDAVGWEVPIGAMGYQFPVTA